MDPNTALTQLRALVTIYRNGGKWNEPETTDLVDLVDGLDGWLSKGGFLPEAWSGVLTKSE